MSGNLRKLVLPAVILGVALIVVAVVYFVEPAHSLPSFFPGHVSAGGAEADHHHTKHGIAALILALACFAFAWFQTGPKARSGDSQSAPLRSGDSHGARPRSEDSQSAPLRSGDSHGARPRSEDSQGAPLRSGDSQGARPAAGSEGEHEGADRA